MSLLLLFRSPAATPWTLGVDPASFAVVGQTITLTVSGAQQVPGGYGFGAGDRTLHRRKKLRQELDDEERQELADRLEKVMLEEGSLTQQKADLLRIRGLANEYQADLPNRVKRAVAYAEKVRTQQALELALREIERMQAEEELAVFLTLTLD